MAYDVWTYHGEDESPAIHTPDVSLKEARAIYERIIKAWPDFLEIIRDRGNRHAQGCRYGWRLEVWIRKSTDEAPVV